MVDQKRLFRLCVCVCAGMGFVDCHDFDVARFILSIYLKQMLIINLYAYFGIILYFIFLMLEKKLPSTLTYP